MSLIFFIFIYISLHRKYVCIFRIFQPIAIKLDRLMYLCLANFISKFGSIRINTFYSYNHIYGLVVNVFF